MTDNRGDRALPSELPTPGPASNWSRPGLKVTGLKSRRELVDFALRELLRHEQQKYLLALKGKADREGNLAEMRAAGEA